MLSTTFLAAGEIALSNASMSWSCKAAMSPTTVESSVALGLARNCLFPPKLGGIPAMITKAFYVFYNIAYKFFWQLRIA
jgi:hypothetical protein